MRTKISLGVYSFVFLWAVIAILFMHVPPSYFWPAAFMALTLPGALMLNFLFLVVWVMRRSWKALLPLAFMVFAWDYHARGMGFSLSDAAPQQGPGQITVLSYNVRIFNTYAHLQQGKDQASSKQMIRWVAENPADVFCLQEFYNDESSPVFNSLQRIGRKQERYTFMSKTLVNRIGAEFGLAIFSRFPIVNKGTIQFGKLTQNHAMFADLKVKHDTIRVYNFHLQSMSIEEKDIVESYRDQQSFKKKGVHLLRRFKRGLVKRSDQVSLLMKHVEESPYPVILCGDLNDVPYSYTYQHLNSNLKNAFQEKGFGFGASYNGRLPFVRIDNQFCSPDLEVASFVLHDTIPYSDHFPITATYQLSQDKD